MTQNCGTDFGDPRYPMPKRNTEINQKIMFAEENSMTDQFNMRMLVICGVAIRIKFTSAILVYENNLLLNTLEGLKLEVQLQ